MEKMMPVMMKGVSPEEKQEMMLKMMPLMMADIDLEELLPKMMSAMLPLLVEHMGCDGHGGKMLDKMAGIMPNVCEVIDKAALAEKKDAMVSKLMEYETFREKMPRCFAKGMPVMVRGCFAHFFPELTKEERKAYISTMVRMMLETGAGDFSDDEVAALLKQ
jgi:hypothetical protein